MFSGIKVCHYLGGVLVMINICSAVEFLGIACALL